jgi:hypothetical protein
MNKIVTGLVVSVLTSHSHDTYVTKPFEKVKFFDGSGPERDKHSGRRLLDVRDREALGFGLIKGSEVFNMRQWSAVSVEESLQISTSLNIPSIPVGYFGENLLFSGIPNLTQLPIGTQIFFKSPKGEIRTTLLFVTGENNPCTTIGQELQKINPDVPDVSKFFGKHAMHKRGLVGIVVSSGFVKEGDNVIVYLP